jgi:hypothetical protein
MGRPVYFDDTQENPTPDRGTGVSGAFSGRVTLDPDDQIEWECEVVNDSDASIAFGTALATHEMCNLFGFAAPGDGTVWTALF